MLRQIMYISSARPLGKRADVAAILEQSRHNNALDGVTGLLYTDGRRFLQIIEGEADAVGETYDRIVRDPRHGAIVLLHDRPVPAREFGDWAMAHRLSEDTADALDARMRRMLLDATPEVRDAFLDLISIRAAA